MKKKINEVLPHIDTIIRLQEAVDAVAGKTLSPFGQPETIEAERDDVQDYFVEGVEWGMMGNCPYVIKASDTAFVSDGCKVVAVDDEEASFESVEAFLALLQDLSTGEGEVMVEIRKPVQKHIKRYRKVKKLGDDVEIPWPEWEAWWLKTQTPEAKRNRLGPKNEKKRDTAIKESLDIVNSLDEGELKTKLVNMLKRFGEPFTREELAEYNFDVKKVLGEIQKKERSMLAEIKEAKKQEAAES